MKVDKEALLKYKFWLIFGGFLALWLGSLAMLQVSASAPLEKAKKDFEDAKKSVATAKGQRPKNEKFNEPWEKYGKGFQAQKDTVWKQAWELQKDMITWPSSASAPFQAVWDRSPTLAEFLKRIAVESTNPNEWRSSLARREYMESLYPSQFKDLDKVVAPVELQGGVPVIFQQVEWQSTPLIEELWLAQEDFWVRRELLGVVRAVLDSVGRFERLPDAKPPQGAVARHQFKNSHWELDLLIERGGRDTSISPKSTIRNVHVSKRAQNLANPRTGKPVEFRLRQGPRSFVLRVEGEPLAWGQSAEFRKATRVDTVDLTKPFQVEQVFDWHTAPVRRVDALAVAQHSHRTAHRSLQVNTALQAMDPKVEAPGGPGGPGGGPGAAGGPAAATGPMATMDSAKGLPGGAGFGMPAENLSPNGLKRERYLHITEQCRHLPVGLLLIVDQAHIHDVLIAMANSRLRVQTTQVHFNHVRGIQPPYSPEEEYGPEVGVGGPLAGGAAAGARPGLPGAVRPGLGRPDAGRMPHTPGAGGPFAIRGPAARPPVAGMPKGPPGMAGMMPGTTGQHAEDTDDPNLVELAVYGIATLYERFPENRGETPTGGAPATPGAPPGTPPVTPPAGTPAPAPAATNPAPAPAATPTPAPATPPTDAAKDKAPASAPDKDKDKAAPKDKTPQPAAPPTDAAKDKDKSGMP